MSKAKSTQIEELFRLPISREINRVVKVEDDNKEVVQSELEEYVLTSLLEKHFVDVLEEIIDSEHKSQDDPGIWISGFFGSGKSHFMKILGYVLENKSLNGRTAADVFKTRTQDETLKGALTSVNDKFNSEVLMFQIGAKENKASGEEDISQIILREFNKEQGYAETPWVAEIEKDLESRGKYQEFKQAIQEESGKSWEEARTQGVFIRKDIQKALAKIGDYTEEEAEKAIDDVEESLVISPETVTEKILKHVEEQEEETGEKQRYFVFLDEISQFIGEDEGGLLELQGLVEEFGRKGDGKLWLGVTSQEKLEMLIEGVLAMSAEESKVRDRFPHRYDLRSQDLDKVIQERILKKDEDAVSLLSEFYGENSGRISTHYKLENAKDAGKIDEDAFVESYPFLPYQLDMLPSIFASLRGTGGEDKLTGKERTLIDVTHSIFNPPHNLREKQVGSLVTLDVIFDEINEDIDDEDVKTIEEASPSDVDEELARRVLKALYLIQQLDWVPNTAENIATALYSEVENVTSFENDVKEALKGLTGSYVVPSDEGYRFPSKVERDIEEDIASIRIMQGDIRRRSKKILSDLFSKADTINYEGSTFDVSVVVDEETVSKDGDIELTAYSPVYQSFESVNEKLIKTQSREEDDSIHWIAEPVGDDLLDDIERALKIDQVIEKKRNTKLSEEEQEALGQKQDDLQRLKNGIKKKLRDSFREGTILYRESDELEETTTRLEKILERYAEKAIPRVFTKLESGLADVQKSDIELMLGDLDSRSLPAVFEELNIVVDGELNPEARICEEIENEIDERRRHGDEITGNAILEKFNNAPYGWDRNVVRIGVAVLFKNGSLKLNHKEKVYSSYTETGAKELFTSIRKFRKTSFEEQGVSKEDRTKAKNLLNVLFDKKVKNTVQDVNEGINEVATEWSKDCADLLPQLRKFSFPLVNEVEEMKRHLNSIKAKKTYAETIETFVDKEDDLESLSRKVGDVFDFEDSGKLEKYGNMRKFLTNDWEKYTELVDGSERVEIDENIEDRAEVLGKTLESESVIEDDNWSDAETGYSKVSQDYVNAYEELYEKRYEVYDEAIEEVREYAEELDVDDEDGIQDATETLKDKRGDESRKLDINKNEHIGVTPEIDRLSEHIEAVDGTYKKKAERKIEELADGGITRGKVSVSRLLSSEIIEDESDIEEAVSKLEGEILNELESNDEVILK